MTFQCFTGMLYHELQVGTVVVQVRRIRPDWQALGVQLDSPRVRVWRDSFGRWL